jgi:hypothetical protein
VRRLPLSFQKVLDNVDAAIRHASTQPGEPPAANGQPSSAESAVPVAA